MRNFFAFFRVFVSVICMCKLAQAQTACQAKDIESLGKDVLPHERHYEHQISTNGTIAMDINTAADLKGLDQRATVEAQDGRTFRCGLHPTPANSPFMSFLYTPAAVASVVRFKIEAFQNGSWHEWSCVPNDISANKYDCGGLVVNFY